MKRRIVSATQKRQALESIAKKMEQVYQPSMYDIKLNKKNNVVEILDKRTGSVCLLVYPSETPIELKRSKVRKATDAEINDYLNTGKPSLYVRESYTSNTTKQTDDISKIRSINSEYK